MQIKEFIHKNLCKERIEQLDMPFYYLPDDYDLPCYHIYIPEDGYEAEDVDVAFYIEIFVNEDNVIQQIVRYRDEMAFTNYECKRFPNAIERNADCLLKQIIV